MFSLRIHSIGGSLCPGGRQRPRIHKTRGIVHLYRRVSHHPEPLPAGRNTLLFVLAVPSRMTIEDFLFFCGLHRGLVTDIEIIRNDAVDDRYSILIDLDDQKGADSFYRKFNGRRFLSSEAEICRILFIGRLEYTESTEIANTPPTGHMELPTCPVCLERLDQDISGILTTIRDHSFQCLRVSKWTDSSCPVCRFCLQQPEKPTCSVCEMSESLWICVICGVVGCGRYKKRHAIRHWKDTQHGYSLDLETQKIWDYVGNTYVHRLNQSKSDDKLVELNSHCRSMGDDNWWTSEYSEDSGISGALFSSEVVAIVDEYIHLLETQLENQRQYYESLLAEAKAKREKPISEAVEKAVNSKLQDIQAKLEKCIDEKKAVADYLPTLPKRVRPSIPVVANDREESSSKTFVDEVARPSTSVPSLSPNASVLRPAEGGSSTPQVDMSVCTLVVDTESDSSETGVSYESPTAEVASLGHYSPPSCEEIGTWEQPGYDEPYMPFSSDEEIDLEALFEGDLVVDEDTSVNIVNEGVVANPEVETREKDAPGTEVAITPSAAAILSSGGELHRPSEGSFSVGSEQMENRRVSKLISRLRYFLSGSEQMENRRVSKLISRLRYFLSEWCDGKPDEFLMDAHLVMECLASLAAEGVGVDAVKRCIEQCLSICRSHKLAATRPAAEQARVEVESALKALEESYQAILSEQQLLIKRCEDRSFAESRLATMRQEMATWLAEIQRLEAEVQTIRVEIQTVESALSADDREGRAAVLDSLAKRLTTLTTERAARAALEAHLSDEAYCEARKAANLRELDAQAKAFVQRALDVLPF